ncbi:MAG: hypothetical protein PHD13_07265 [Methanocellales archaeon]|nr:hypothetical protein [Methanocellales archaeon]MDD3292250.1 hypothetical protein [Methanocellales archaeon]MDD5235956.1 hypothetical protein [Methanocellales archaeon]MDD5484866.1 hypothetical protein [Methanocellales archaeon]
MRGYKKVDRTGETNPRSRGNKGARIPVISILLMVAFVGIFAAMVATYVLVPEPTPMPTPRPTPKPTPPPTTGEIESLRFENLVVYASEQSTTERSRDTALMDVTGVGAVNQLEVVATVDGIATYLRSTGGTPIQPGEQVLLVSVERIAACGCPQPIVTIDPGQEVRVVVRHMPTRHVFVDTTVTAIAGDQFDLM